MKKILSVILFFLTPICLLAPVAFAEEEAVTKAPPEVMINYYALAVLGCALGIGFAALGTGIGMGLGIGRATEGVARNPAVTGKITTVLIIGLALIESLAIYALVVVLIILFAKPFGF